MQLLSLATTVVFADADAGELTLEVIRQFNVVNEKPVICLNNRYKPRAVRADTLYVYDTPDQIRARVTEDQDRSYVCSDSKREAEILHSLIGGDSLLFTSETKKEMTDHIVNISEVAKTVKAIIGSPSLGTGVSIDGDHGLSRCYAVFSGKTTTSEQALQQLARARELSDYHVALPPVTEGVSKNPTAWREIAKLYISDPISRSNSGIDMSFNPNGSVDPISRLWCMAKANQNRSRHNFRNNFLRLAAEEGFTIKIVGDKIISTEAVKRITKSKTAAKKIREDKKIEKIEELTSFLTEECGMVDAESSAIADAQVRKNSASKILAHILPTSLADSFIDHLDKTEVGRCKKGWLSQKDLGHHTEKRKLTNMLLSIAGVNYDPLLRSFVRTDNQVDRWGTGDASRFTSFLSDYQDQLLIHFGISKKSDYSKQPFKRFNEALAALGVSVTTDRVSSCERVSYVSNDSLNLINIVMSNQESVRAANSN